MRELMERGLRARLLVDDAHTPHVINIIDGKKSGRNKNK